MQEDIYLYTTRSVLKNGEQIGHTELYAPTLYGGVFLGIIVNGMLISGHKRNGEFVSEEYHGCHISTPTAESLAFQNTPGRYNRHTDSEAEIVCEKRGFTTPRDACTQENQIGTTEISRLTARQVGLCPRTLMHRGHLDKRGNMTSIDRTKE